MLVFVLHVCAGVHGCLLACLRACVYIVKILACESLYVVTSPTRNSMLLADSHNPEDSQPLPLPPNGET